MPGGYLGTLGLHFGTLGLHFGGLGLPRVPQGDFFALMGGTFATLRIPLGSTLEHFGSPRVSFWSLFGTFWHHLDNLGHLVEIAISPWEYCDFSNFGEPWDITFSQKISKMS